MTRGQGSPTRLSGHSWLACYPMPSTAAYVRLCWGHRVKLPCPLCASPEFERRGFLCLALNRVGRARSAHDLTTSQQGRARTIRAGSDFHRLSTLFFEESLVYPQERERPQAVKQKFVCALPPVGGRDHCASRAEPWEEVIARVNGKNAYLISFPDCAWGRRDGDDLCPDPFCLLSSASLREHLRDIAAAEGTSN